MCKGSIFLSAIGALAFATLLSDCSSAPSLPSQTAMTTLRVPSIALPTFIRSIQSSQPTPGTPPNELINIMPDDMFIYTAQLYGDDAKIYRRRGDSITFVDRLTLGLSAPQGTVATPNGWWFVANAGHSNVLVYRSTNHGPREPVAALDDYGEFPGNVGVTPDRRLVAVSNISTTNNGAGSVSVYLNRQSEPSRLLRYAGGNVRGTGVAVDHHGNCYWSFNSPQTLRGAIVEFVDCRGRGRLVVPAIGYAGGLAFDQRDDLYYVDQTTGIYRCDQTKNCALFAMGFGVPLNINFDHRQKHLWVSDLSGYIDAVDPATGVIESRTHARGGSTDPPFGVAPEPGD
jgi:DNA-binding beta-propeller fold protein YncE